jgi:hypothetical protein
MGLRLKCPGCQAPNLLSARVCSACGQSLDNLPPQQRVYVIGAPGAPSPPPAPRPQAPPPSTGGPPPAPKMPRKPRKKKA